MRIYLLLFLLAQSFVYSQKAKHGSLTINTLNVKINEFTTLSANASAGNTTLNVAASSLNANSRFTSTLQVGDLLLIIQPQGAIIKTFAAVAGQDSTYGEILNYNGAGKYEFVQVFAIPNATSIVIDCGLQNNYLIAGKTQVIRVPRYNNLTINSGASLTSDAWNGSIGGVITAEVSGLTTVNGTITATGLGFRGGVAINNGTFGGGRFVDLGGGANEGGEKGESVAGSAIEYAALYGGQYAKGAPANGGGGGNSHNAGGGGGANAGNISGWFGTGMISPSYTLAYSLEYLNRHTISSSGGGRGGYCFSSANLNPNGVAPGNPLWGGDGRRNHGGFGGRPLDYSTGSLYFGGGGGAGHVNNISATNSGGHGGAGGGLIIFNCYGNITGTGEITSNGINGTTATGPNPGFNSNVNGIDAAGGGGAGGTIVLATTGTVTSVALNANGGLGGNQAIVKGTFAGSNTEAEGPGGGGSGGYIAFSFGTPAQSVLGASSGTTNSVAMTNFPPNGASNGANGLMSQDIKLYIIDIPSTTVCVNSVATLTATTNSPLATGFSWYNSIAGTSLIATGNVFTSSVLTTPGVYTVYAGFCPGNFRQMATITVINSPTITVNTASICALQDATLTASGASSYTWSTAAISNSIIVSPVSTTVYTVTGQNGCLAQATTTVFVEAFPTVTITPSSTLICASQSITLFANGNVPTYTWSTGPVNTPSISVGSFGIYTVTVNNSCGSATHSVSIFEGPSISLGLSATANTICTGGTVTLVASGTGTFAWSTSTVNTNSINVTTPGIYFVTLTNQCGVSSTSVNVTAGNPPVIGVVPSSSVFCAGNQAVYTSTGSATSYTWSNGSTLPTFSTSSAGNFSVIGTNSCGTTSSVFSVTFQTSPDVSMVATRTFVCLNDTATILATNFSGGGNFNWSSSANTSSVEVISGGGTYFVSYTNGCGIASSSISIRQSTLTPAFIFSPNNTPSPASISFTNTSTNNTNNSWNSGNGQTSNTLDQNFQYNSPGIYTVTLLIENSDGCLAAVSETLQILDELPVIPILGTIPQLISPNNDGKNDAFEIKGITNYPNNQLQIFNRWGNIVYSQNGYINTFNGTPNYKSSASGKVPAGTYFYILNLGDSENKVFKGFVEIVY